MDSCIEELALVISDRATTGAQNNDADLGAGFASIAASADHIIRVIWEYRSKHPELYSEPAHDQFLKLRGEADTYKAELISARQELARYKEREKVCGWDNS